MERTFQTVRDQLSHAFQRAKQVYDGRVEKLQFKVDDLVWFFLPQKSASFRTEMAIVDNGTVES